jgi:hypothetical protein
VAGHSKLVHTAAAGCCITFKAEPAFSIEDCLLPVHVHVSELLQAAQLICQACLLQAYHFSC